MSAGQAGESGTTSEALGKGCGTVEHPALARVRRAVPEIESLRESQSDQLITGRTGQRHWVNNNRAYIRFLRFDKGGSLNSFFESLSECNPAVVLLNRIPDQTFKRKTERSAKINIPVKKPRVFVRNFAIRTAPCVIHE